MKQMFLMVNNGDVKIIDTPCPTCKSGYLLVETIYSLVSAGTERMLASFAQGSLLKKVKERPDQIKTVLDKMASDGAINTIQSAFGRLNEPMPIGYSAVGRVVEVGKGVTDIIPGDTVAMVGQAYHAEVNCINRNLVVKLQEGFPDIRQAAFGALGGIALQGIHQAEVQPGESVAVIGLGLLGHITSQILNAYGCDVIGFDIDESKMLGARYIKKFIDSNASNAAEIVKGLTAGFGVDKIIITASTSSNQPIELASSIARDRAIISMIGVTAMNLDRRPFYEKELSFKLARSYGPGRYNSDYENKGIDYPIGHVRWTENRNLAEYIRLVQSKRIDVRPLITHEFEIVNAEMAYQLITTNAKNEKYIGILINYPSRKEKLSNTITICKKIQKIDKKVIGVGIIGAGSFTRYTVLPTMKETGKYKLVGLVTTGGTNSALANEVHQFEYVTTDVDKVMNDKSIDLIVVTTRHDMHADFVIKALQSGKHVYCEKPLAINKEQLDKIKAAYDTSDRHLFVGFNRRYSPFIQKIKKKLDTGSFPAVYQYTVNAGYIKGDHWTQDEEAGGGRVIGEVCHFVDTLQYLSDSKIKDMNILWVDDNGQYNKADNCTINILFENGSIGNIIYSSKGCKSYPKENLKVFINGSVAELTNYLKVDWYEGSKRTTFKLKQDKGFYNEYMNIYNVLSGNETINSFDDIWDNHEFLLEQIQNRKLGTNL